MRRRIPSCHPWRQCHIESSILITGRRQAFEKINPLIALNTPEIADVQTYVYGLVACIQKDNDLLPGERSHKTVASGSIIDPDSRNLTQAQRCAGTTRPNCSSIKVGQLLIGRIPGHSSPSVLSVLPLQSGFVAIVDHRDAGVCQLECRSQHMACAITVTKRQQARRIV